MPEAGNPQAFNRYAFVLDNPLKYTDPSGHYYCTGGELDEAACTTWVEAMLSDLAASGPTGWELVRLFRNRDAALKASGPGDGGYSREALYGIHIDFTPLVPGGMGVGNTLSLNDRYASSPLSAVDLALVGHELTHILTQDSSRYTTRGEAEAYANQGRILDDLGKPKSDTMKAAMSTNLNDAKQLAEFKKKLVETTLAVDLGRAITSLIYWVEPLGAPPGGQQARTGPTQPGRR